MSELELTLGWVARAVGGSAASGDPGRRRSATSSPTAGSLRPAICSWRCAGRGSTATTFVADVLGRGAAGGDRRARRRAGDAETPAATAVIEVGDTLQALQDLAHAVRMAAGTRVIAITGSAGKTTTKETIAELLATRDPRGEEQGEPEQPHRPAAVADAAAHQARCGGDGTGDESRRGDQHAGRDCRAGRSRVDERRRRAPRLLCVSRCDCRRQGRDPRAARRRRRCSSATPTIRA